MPKTYTCDECGGTFEQEWTDADAMAEAQQVFGAANIADTEMAQVCDDCYKAIMGREPELLAKAAVDPELTTAEREMLEYRWSQLKCSCHEFLPCPKHGMNRVI